MHKIFLITSVEKKKNEQINAPLEIRFSMKINPIFSLFPRKSEGLNIGNNRDVLKTNYALCAV